LIPRPGKGEKRIFDKRINQTIEGPEEREWASFKSFHHNDIANCKGQVVRTWHAKEKASQEEDMRDPRDAQLGSKRPDHMRLCVKRF
jgi:hypothetical protein